MEWFAAEMKTHNQSSRPQSFQRLKERAAEDSHSTTSFRNKNKKNFYFYLLHFTCGMRENKNIL